MICRVQWMRSRDKSKGHFDGKRMTIGVVYRLAFSYNNNRYQNFLFHYEAHMLTFIPPLNLESCHLSEYRVYQLLTESKLDGYVFHSLMLPCHEEKVIGEIDFVLLTRHGILCLEVKGGEVVYEDGYWIHVDFANRNHIKTEGPFKQVASNMFSLKSQAYRCLPHNHIIQSTLFGCGVMFPDIYFNAHSLEYAREWIFDQSSFDKGIDDYLLKLYGFWRHNRLESGKPILDLNEQKVEMIAQYFRQDFHCKVLLPAIIETIEKQQILLTEEQFELLRDLFDNPRVLVNGGAGTGKTVIAVHAASECARKGAKVLYLTYNKLIAQDIRKSLNIPNLKVVCLHDYLLEVTGLAVPADPKAQSLFYSHSLPEAFLTLNEAQMTQYDTLIIDEGQDLLNEVYLSCFERLLINGLQGGNWLVFYDQYQNLYNGNLEDGLMLIRSLNPVEFKLQMNCRNTRQIAEFNEKSTAIAAARVLKITGDEVTLVVSNNPQQLLKDVQQRVKELIKAGINLSDVVILSSHRKDKSKLFAVSSKPFESICRFETATTETWHLIPDNTLRFMTVHSFKGLEAKIVLLVDFEEDSIGSHNDFDATAYRNMLRYTAISRAKVMLFEFRVEE